MIKKETNYSESKFWKFINLAGNAMGANMMFIIFCLPIVTIGPATSGLYSAIRYMIRNDGWFQGFMEGFKKNFLRTMIAGIVAVAVMVYLIFNFSVALNFYFETGDIMPAITNAIPMLFPSLIAAALWPLNIYIPYGITDWLKNAVNLIVKAPLMVLFSALLWWAPVFAILYFMQYLLPFIILIIGVYYALTVFISTIILKDSLVVQLNLYRQEHAEEQEDEIGEEQ